MVVMWVGRHGGRGTYPNGKALAEEELPVDRAFCDEERADCEHDGPNKKGEMQVSAVEETADHEAWEEGEGVLQK